MGNLCSSGTDRTEKKKEDVQLPGKPQDGEGEALLSKVGEGAADENSGGGEDGGGGGGLGGFVGGLVDSGKTAATDVVAEVKEDAVQIKDGAVEKGKEVATDVKNAVTQAVTGVKDKGSEAVENVENKTEAAVEDVKESGAQIAENANVAATQGVNSADDKLANFSKGMSSTLDAAKDDVAGAGDMISSEASALKSETVAAVESVKTEAENVKADAEDQTAAAEESQGGFMDNIKQNVSEKVEEVKEVAEEKVDDAKQTAENRLNEAVESAKASVMGSFSSTEEKADKVEKEVENASDAVSEAKQGVETSADETQNTVSGGIGNMSDFGSSLTSGVEAAKENVEAKSDSLKSEAVEEVKTVADDAAAVAEEKVAEKVDDVENAASEKLSDLGGFSADLSAGLADKIDSVASETESSVNKVSDDVAEVVEEAAVSAEQASTECAPPQAEEPESSGLLDKVVDASKGALQSGAAFVGAKVGDLLGSDEKQSEEPQASENGSSKVEVTSPSEEEDFLDKAKSLLEHHRNSIDETKMASGASAADDAGNDDNNNEELSPITQSTIPEEVTDKVREEAARDFVDGIIEKATTIVSESMADQEAESPSAAAADTAPAERDDAHEESVERGEETLEVKKRGVCFVSPQISDTSSSPLSSPPEILPSPEIASPPAVQDIESPASSISQGELVERDIELELPSPPQSMQQDTDVTSPDNEGSSVVEESDEAPLDNRPAVIEGGEGTENIDDESLQRIATEVTTKAVQDAIKIVTENGTGVALTLDNNNDNETNDSSPLVNSVEVSSPSSDDRDRDEEDMTTTNSSQVERGSSVSDLTDNSQPGSIAESLSSYDPGAVYRQDLADMSSSPVEAEAEPATASEGGSFEPCSSVAADLSVDVGSLNAVDGSSAAAETPTPTNATSFDDAYPDPPPPPPPQVDDEKTEPPPPPQQQENDNSSNAVEEISDLPPPPPPPSSEPVPSSLPDIDTSSSKPTIVINSPDSAPNTNGSLEDVSAAATTTQ